VSIDIYLKSEQHKARTQRRLIGRIVREGAANLVGPTVTSSAPTLCLSIIHVNKNEVKRVFLQMFLKAKRYGGANDTVKNALNNGHNTYKDAQHLPIRKETISGLISNNPATIANGDVIMHGTGAIHFVYLITFFVSNKVSEDSLDMVSLLDIILIQDATLL
jgi:hypothetical protein